MDAAFEQRPCRLSNIGHWSLREWVAILTFAGFLLILKVVGAPSVLEEQQLRGQFRLPDSVALTKIYIGRSKAKALPGDIEGFVQFTDTQFRRYVATLDDANIWRPLPIVHGGTEFYGPYSPEALLWRDMRGAIQLAWGSLSWKQAQEVRSGRLLCFAMRGDDGGGRKMPVHGEPCPPPNTPTVKAVYVQGLLDFDTRTLHMLIRQTHPRRAG